VTVVGTPSAHVGASQAICELTLASLPLNWTGTTTEPSARPSTVTTWEEPGEVDDRGDERFRIGDHKLCWGVGRRVGDDEVHHAIAVHAGDCGGAGRRRGIGDSTEADEAAGGDSRRRDEM
jgi:hypothetical protein